MRVRIVGNDGGILERNLAVLLARSGHSVGDDGDVEVSIGTNGGHIAVLPHHGEETELADRVYRPANVFGRWDDAPSGFNGWLRDCARDGFRPIGADAPFDATPIDAACDIVLALLEGAPVPGNGSTRIRPADAEGFVHRFGDMRGSARFAAMDDPFVRQLHAAYLSHLDGENLLYSLDMKSDDRGCLAEIMKSPEIGQVFMSWSKPGVVRGAHYHDRKAEKFFVLSGTARVRLRHFLTDDRREFLIHGREMKAVDIPPGWVHDIANVGEDDMLALFWVSQMFDPNDLDTHLAPIEVDA